MVAVTQVFSMVDKTSATPRRRAPTISTITVSGRRIVVIARPLPLRRRKRR
jgi:hypothetical protein